MGATVTGMTELIDDFRHAAEDVVEEARKVVSKGSLNVKRDTRKKWRGATYAPALYLAVGYDVTVRSATISSEIGPDKDKRQGALGNIYEYGVPGTAPQPALNPALEAEEPRFLDAVGDLGEGLLTGAAPAPEPPRD